MSDCNHRDNHPFANTDARARQPTRCPTVRLGRPLLSARAAPDVEAAAAPLMPRVISLSRAGWSDTALSIRLALEERLSQTVTAGEQLFAIRFDATVSAMPRRG
jgi:hypothetical protein